jgi:predicted nucleotidyltransferase
MPTTPVQTKTQVLALLQEHDQELYRFGVKRCGIFGSFVRDAKIHPQSDVDILVAFEPDQKTFDNFMNLSFFLEALFGRTVDLVTVESLSPYIGPRILDEVEYVSIRPRIPTAHS